MVERMLKTEVESRIDSILLKTRNVNSIQLSIILWLNNMEIWVYAGDAIGDVDLPIVVEDIQKALDLFDSLERLILYKKQR
jgi:hypothetical protein